MCVLAAYHATALGIGRWTICKGRLTWTEVVQKVMEVSGGVGPDFFRGKTAQLAYLHRDFPHKSRFVALAAMRNGREVRAIGLDKHAIQRDHAGRITNILCLGIRDIACERNNEAKIERGARMFDGASETVHHAAQSGCAPLLADQSQQVVPRIFAVIGWPAVNDDRELG